MRNNFVLIFILFSILSVAYASPTVIDISVSYNPSTNTITISPTTANIPISYNSLYYLNFTVSGANSLTTNMILIAPLSPKITYIPKTQNIAINSSAFWLNQTLPVITSNTATFSIINYSIIPPPPVVVNLGSYNASWTSPVSISKSSSIYSITGTINQIPKLNLIKVITPSWVSNEVVANSTIGLNITVLKIAGLNISKTIAPSWTQNQTLNNPLYGINITVSKIPLLNINKVIVPSWTSKQTISNSTIGLNITVLQIPKLNITQTISPSWTQTQTLNNPLYGINITVAKIPSLNINKVVAPSWTTQQTINNSTVGLDIVIDKIPKLNITQTLMPGQQYKNDTYGISIFAAPITANMLTTNDLISYYNSQTSNCLSYINFTSVNGTKYSICARGAGQSNYSIVNICTGLAKYTNISSGLAGCVGSFAQLANSSAMYWHKQYLTTFAQLQNVTSQFEAYKSGAAAGAAYAQTAYMFAGVIGLMILAVFIYELNKKHTQLSMVRPPINKV